MISAIKGQKSRQKKKLSNLMVVFGIMATPVTGFYGSDEVRSAANHRFAKSDVDKCRGDDHHGDVV